VRNPRAFLARRGIELADDVELRIYERKGRVSGEEVAEPLHTKELVEYARALDVPLGLQSWWQGSHQGCPFGTVPFTTTKKVTVCELWGLAAEGREWVQDVPGTAFGHWVYTNVHGVCLASHEVEVEVTECLPRLTLTTP